MFISKTYCTLVIFCVVSFSLNDYLNPPGKKRVQILHHLQRCEMRFSMAELPKRLRRFIWRTLLFSSVPIRSIFKSGFWSGKSFNAVTSSSVTLSCVAHDQWYITHSFRKNSPSFRCSIKLFFNENFKVGDRSRGRPEGSLFSSYYTEV